MALIVGAGLVVTVALGGLMFALRTSGDKQINYYSHEVVFVEPGGRVFFYPKRNETLIKVWSLKDAPPGMTYQVWAIEDGIPRTLAITQPSHFYEEIDLFLHEDLSRAEAVIVTIEQEPGSLVPSTKPVVSMYR